jgi:hypothetical protein
MAINNDIGRDGLPSSPIPGRDGSANRPNPKNSAFGEHALPITWTDKMKENPMKLSRVVDWPRVPTRIRPPWPVYGGVALKENVRSDAIGALMRMDAGSKL